MTKLSKEGRDALESLRIGPTVQTFPDAVADPLIEAGYVRVAAVDPAPKTGKAINITSAGRGALLSKAGKSEPVDTAPSAA